MASSTTLQTISQALRSYFASTLSSAIIFLAVMVALIVLWFLLRWLAPMRNRHKELAAVFNNLCRAHGLARKQAEVLADVADALDIETPALLFVQPALLAGYRRGLSPGDAERQVVEDLQHMLFDDVLGEPPPPGG